MANAIICNCYPNSGIDWNDRPKDPSRFEDRLADIYMGKSLKSDMSFYVESDDTTIPAHSFIVSAASEVLDKLIYGTGSIVNSDRVVKVPDCPKEEFLLLLRYLYTGSIQVVLTIEQATVLLPLAYYFGLSHFEDICGNSIAVSLTPTNVCKTFDRIHFMDNVVTDKCIDTMMLNMKTILANGSLMAMQYAAVENILARNELLIGCESVLFMSMLQWAKKECKNQKLDVNPSNRRAILKDRIYLVRFGLMSANRFGKCVLLAGKDFFTPDEIVFIMHAICGINCDLMENRKVFSCTPRIGGVFYELIDFYNLEHQKNRTINSTNNEFLENIKLTKMDDKVALIGFVTDARVFKIYKKSRTNLPFIQTNKKVFFKRPIRFVGGKCTFVIRYTNVHMPLVFSTTVGKRMNIVNDSGETSIAALIYTFLK